jgi:hypothetical protein
MSDTEYSRQQPSPGGAPPVTADTIIESLAPIEQREMAAARGLAAKLGPEVSKTMDAVNGHLHRVATIAGKHAAELERLQADDMSNPEGIKSRIAEIRKKAPGDVQSAIDDAATVVDSVLTSQLLMGAMPTIAPEDRAGAVDEVRMLIEASGQDRITTLRAIAAGRDRRLAAVVTGSWGRAAVGGDDQLHHALQLLALEGVKKYGTPTEMAHAAAFGTLTATARKAIGAARARARHRIGGDL